MIGGALGNLLTALAGCAMGATISAARKSFAAEAALRGVVDSRKCFAAEADNNAGTERATLQEEGALRGVVDSCVMPAALPFSFLPAHLRPSPGDACIKRGFAELALLCDNLGCRIDKAAPRCACDSALVGLIVGLNAKSRAVASNSGGGLNMQRPDVPGEGLAILVGELAMFGVCEASAGGDSEPLVTMSSGGTNLGIGSG